MKGARNLPQIQARTSEENRDWLKLMAQEQDRSMNWLINKIIDDAREADSKKKNAAH